MRHMQLCVVQVATIINLHLRAVPGYAAVASTSAQLDMSCTSLARCSYEYCMLLHVHTAIMCKGSRDLL